MKDSNIFLRNKDAIENKLNKLKSKIEDEMDISICNSEVDLEIREANYNSKNRDLVKEIGFCWRDFYFCCTNIRDFYYKEYGKFKNKYMNCLVSDSLDKESELKQYFDGMYHCNAMINFVSEHLIHDNKKYIIQDLKRAIKENLETLKLLNLKPKSKHNESLSDYLLAENRSYNSILNFIYEYYSSLTEENYMKIYNSLPKIGCETYLTFIDGN